jgi:hypothetical protein
MLKTITGAMREPKEKTVQMRKVGKSDLEVSATGTGCTNLILETAKAAEIAGQDRGL